MRSIMRKTKSSEAPGERQERVDRDMESAFSLSDAASLRVFRRDDRGQLKILDVLTLNAVPNSDELISTIQERWGGGRYYVLPTIDGKKASDGFPLEFDGPPKQAKKQRNSDDESSGGKSVRNKELEELRDKIKELEKLKEEDRLIQRVREEIKAAIPQSSGSKEVISSLVSGLPQLITGLVTGLAGIMGNKESASDMLEKISSIWRNVQSSMPEMPNPVAMAREMASLIFDLVNQARPPAVSTSGTGASFWATLLAELGRQFAQPGGFPGTTQQTPQIGQGTPATALAGIQQQGGGFSGIPQQTAAPQGQPSGAISGFTLATLVEDPIARVREMLKFRDDPDEIARVVVYLFDFVSGFSRPASPYMGYISNFLAAPAVGFDRIIPHIPELKGADPHYVARLRNSIVKAVEDYMLQLRHQQAEATSESSQREAEKKEPPFSLEDLLGSESEEQQPEPKPKATTVIEDAQGGKEEASVRPAAG